MTILYAGVSRGNISPSVGIFLMGYGNRVQGNIGIHDELYATTLILDDGQTRAAIVTVDLAFINARIVAQIKSQLQKKLNLSPEAVFICCSHTHAGPVGDADENSPPENQAYIRHLIEIIVQSAEDAFQKREVVTLHAGTDEAHININRREKLPDGSIIIGQNPSDIVDHSVQIIQVVNQANKILATLVNYACHPVVMGPLNRQVSADWVGAMRRVVEASTQSLCLFLQGTTADINPRKMRWTADSWDEVDEQGTAVAEAVLRASQQTTLLNIGTIQIQQQTQWIKLLPAKGYNQAIRAFLPPDLSEAEIRAAIFKEMPWHNELIERANGTYTPLNIGTLRLGDWALATLETEPFTETGLAIKKGSPAKMTFVAGYTNGCNSYLPIESAYQDGGYEVETAPLFYGLPAGFAPGSAESITQAILNMLNS